MKRWNSDLSASPTVYSGPSAVYDLWVIHSSGNFTHVIIANDDGKVRCWDQADGTTSVTKFILPKPSGARAAYRLAVVQGKLIVGYWSGHIAAWNFSNGLPSSPPTNGEILPNKVLQGGGAPITALATDGTNLYSGNYDGQIKKWEIPSGILTGSTSITSSNHITLKRDITDIQVTGIRSVLHRVVNVIFIS